MKKFSLFFIIFSLFFLFPFSVFASDGILARIGNKYYDTLEDAIMSAGANDVVVMTSNVVLDNSLDINKTVNLDLNGYTVSSDNKVFNVYGGSLNLIGTGTVKENKPYYGAIVVMGSSDIDDKEFSTVSVASGITLEGWSGIFVDHNDNNESVSYGININFDGKINGIDDIDGGSGVGIYINGNVKSVDNYPVVTLGDTASITATGNGIYVAGYTKLNINGAYIAGEESGIAIKAGIINMNSGTVLCDGEDKTPTSGFTDGVKPSGTAIQIESNNGYRGDIELYIKDGKVQSKNSNAIYEYVAGSAGTKVKNISLSGGEFLAGNSKNVFAFSSGFVNNIGGFVTGGVYSTNPNQYVKSGYSVVNEGGLYSVVKSAMGDNYLSVNNMENGGVSVITILIVLLVIVLLVLAYLKKDVIFKFFKKR